MVQRSIVHWDLPESMRETDIKVILERGKEKYPEAKPRIIPDNGPQVHRTRFQGVRSNLRYDACANFTVLSPVEREDRALAEAVLLSKYRSPVPPQSLTWPPKALWSWHSQETIQAILYPRSSAFFLKHKTKLQTGDKHLPPLQTLSNWQMTCCL
jgi:hypothetical protein